MTAPDPPIAPDLNILRAPDRHGRAQSCRSRSAAPRPLPTRLTGRPRLIRVATTRRHPHHQYNWRPGRRRRVLPPAGGQRLLPPHRGGGTENHAHGKRLVPPSLPWGGGAPLPPIRGWGLTVLQRTRLEARPQPPTIRRPLPFPLLARGGSMCRVGVRHTVDAWSEGGLTAPLTDLRLE